MKPFIPAWLDDSGLSPADMRVFVHLCRSADNQSGISWPSYARMVEITGMSRATIARSVSELERRKLIEKIGKPFGGSCRYRVLPIVSPESGLNDSNSLTREHIEAAPIVSPENCNMQRDETPIVSPESKEGNPKKVIQRRVSKIENSPEGIEFAKWFKSTLPETINLKSDWQDTFAKAHDDLVRLDHRSPEEIRRVSQWARSDGFWKVQFMSPAKLRKRNGDGITYYDLFSERMKQPTRGSTDHREEKRKREWAEQQGKKLPRL